MVLSWQDSSWCKILRKENTIQSESLQQHPVEIVATFMSSWVPVKPKRYFSEYLSSYLSFMSIWGRNEDISWKKMETSSLDMVSQQPSGQNWFKWDHLHQPVLPTGKDAIRAENSLLWFPLFIRENQPPSRIVNINWWSSPIKYAAFKTIPLMDGI